MKIAVTYENGNIFQHFGRTESFKVYEVEDGKVVSSEVIGSDGIGHGALAGLLAGNDIQVLICGGLGGGALNALKNAGIEVCAGASGNADEAVEAYLRGDLVDSGANCDHHHHEEGDECCGGHHEGEDHECCGGHGEGGGCCGRHAQQLTLEGKNAGKSVRVHYRGTFDDGTQFDSSYDRGETLDFVCGTGMMIRGFDKTIEIAQLPGSENLNVGERVYLRNMMGQPFPVTVTAKDDTTITLDANHEMAGRELNFHIELIEVQE